MGASRHRLAGEVKKILRPLYWGLASRLPVASRRHFLHLVRLGRLGDFEDPQTFNEKLNWRVLHDRREVIVQACDKLAMKEVARSKVSGPELRIPQTYWAGTDLLQAPTLQDLPPHVIKPNHSSGRVILGPQPGVTSADLTPEVAPWVRTTPGTVLGEWGYTRARPLILIEERLPGEGVPDDFKFYCFDGVPQMITVNSGRFDGDFTASLYTPDWEPLGVRWGDAPSAEIARPTHLAEMLALAGRLSEGWDFIRVDLYAIGEEIWFGEFTPYPGGGVQRFVPRGYDRTLGELWTLPGDVDGGSGPGTAERVADRP